MRVIGGKWKGIKLVSFRHPGVRPMTDMVRESLFNILQNELTPHSRVLDLFCGTGSLGLEALSRGVAHVTFVDFSVDSIRVLRKNIQLLDVPETEFIVSQSDAWRFIEGDLSTFNLIFIDPPFTKKWSHKIMERLAKNPTLSSHSLITIQRCRREFFAQEYPPLIEWKVRNYSDKKLHIFVTR